MGNSTTSDVVVRTSPLYKERPLVQYCGPSMVAAVYVARAGNMMLFLFGISAGIMVLCRGTQVNLQYHYFHCCLVHVYDWLSTVGI